MKLVIVAHVQYCLLFTDIISIYIGHVYVGLKDAIFEHSTPQRHACELYSILQSRSFSKPVLFVYSDGGPDHRLTYMSVKLSLICLF